MKREKKNLKQLIILLFLFLLTILALHNIRCYLKKGCETYTHMRHVHNFTKTDTFNERKD